MQLVWSPTHEASTDRRALASSHSHTVQREQGPCMGLDVGLGPVGGPLKNLI